MATGKRPPATRQGRGPTRPENTPGHHPLVEQDKPTAPPPVRSPPLPAVVRTRRTRLPQPSPCWSPPPSAAGSATDRSFRARSPSARRRSSVPLAPFTLALEEHFLSFPEFALLTCCFHEIARRYGIRMQRHVPEYKSQLSVVFTHEFFNDWTECSTRFALGIDKLNQRDLRIGGAESRAVIADQGTVRCGRRLLTAFLERAFIVAGTNKGCDHNQAGNSE